MIAECCADLVARIITVPSLTNTTGVTLGGRGVDPGLISIPLPACWVTFSHHQVDETPFGATSRGGPGSVPGVENTLGTFAAVIFVPYIDDADMFTTQFPLLEAVIKAVKDNMGTAPSGHRWRFVGQKLSLVQPERLGYEQHYTLRMMI